MGSLTDDVNQIQQRVVHWRRATSSSWRAVHCVVVIIKADKIMGAGLLAGGTINLFDVDRKN